MQQLNVSLSIPIPDDKILISKVELEDLEKQKLKGVYWTMKDLEERTKKKRVWLQENVLYPSKFRKILDVQNGGFVFYPPSTGHQWAFHAEKMADFLDKYFHQIFKEAK